MNTNISRLFLAVSEALAVHRQELNAADAENGNHGEHMVEIFRVASQAAREKLDEGLPAAMEHAAHRLAQLPRNDSAQEYARGLEQFARQFAAHQISQDDLFIYLKDLLREKTGEGEAQEQPKSIAVQMETAGTLKALMNGLAGWQQAANGITPGDKPLDFGFLFELGITYMQARGRNDSKIETLADAAATASPLARVPHRYLSGKLAIRAFLEEVARG